MIRKRALDEIAETSYIGDWEIRHYIRDRTVIEDTESTIDMGMHGWRLFNYPERLSYSATPPDFGSLCIQRRRWANGGLLILPKLHRQSRARRREGRRTRFGELFLRWNYMASISWSSVSLLILLAFPFSATLISPLLGLVALPYFLAMASDLRYCGYKRLDVLRIYGFNLVLLPVNLAGTLSSIVQGITASKAPFARTPKVRNRTVVPPFFVVAPYLLIALAGYTCYLAYRHHLVENMVYAALNVILACYAVKAFIGLRNSVVDVWIHATSLLYKSAAPSPSAAQGPGAAAGRAAGRLAVRARGRVSSSPSIGSPSIGSRAPASRAPAAEHRTAHPGPVPRAAAPPVPAPAEPAGEPRRRLSRAPRARGPRRGGRGRLRRVLRRQDAAGEHRGRPPDLVRALRRRHADADLPVPELLGRPGAAEPCSVSWSRRSRRLHAELGRRLHAGPGRPDARGELAHRAGAAGRAAGRSCRSAARPTPASTSPAPACPG